MSGLERVVRPVVFPDIRPQVARQLPPEEDPTKGICEIKGQGSFVTQWSINTSWSITYGKQKEIKRQVDTARVYQKTDDGKVKKENFVDIQVANKIWMRGPKAPTSMMKPGSERENLPGKTAYETWPEYFKRVKAKDNIEIKKQDEILRNEETSSE